MTARIFEVKGGPKYFQQILPWCAAYQDNLSNLVGTGFIFPWGNGEQRSCDRAAPKAPRLRRGVRGASPGIFLKLKSLESIWLNQIVFFLPMHVWSQIPFFILMQHIDDNN